MGQDANDPLFPFDKALVSRKPQVPVTVFVHGTEKSAGQSVLFREERKFAVSKSGDAISDQIHPDAAIARNNKTRDLIRGQSVPGRIAMNCAGLHSAETRAQRCKPQRSIRRFSNGLNVIFRQAAIGSVIDHKLDAVEANQAFLGSKPDISVASLREGTY